MGSSDKQRKKEKQLHTCLRGEDEVGAFKQFSEDLDIKSQREAARQAVLLGLSSAGYNGAKIERDTGLMRFLARIVEVSGIAGLSIALWGVGTGDLAAIRAGAVFVLVMGMFALAHQLAQRVEPRVSCKIRDMVDPAGDLWGWRGERE